MSDEAPTRISPYFRKQAARAPPPCSPLGLLEEAFSNDPWRLLVVCLLLNQSRAEAVRKVLDPLFSRFPSPATLAHAPHGDLESLLRPLGLQTRRASLLVAFSAAFARGDWSDPAELPGVGRYASDAYRMFVLGDVVGTQPEVTTILRARLAISHTHTLPSPPCYASVTPGSCRTMRCGATALGSCPPLPALWRQQGSRTTRVDVQRSDAGKAWRPG